MFDLFFDIKSYKYYAFKMNKDESLFIYGGEEG